MTQFSNLKRTSIITCVGSIVFIIGAIFFALLMILIHPQISHFQRVEAAGKMFSPIWNIIGSITLFVIGIGAFYLSIKLKRATTSSIAIIFIAVSSILISLFLMNIIGVIPTIESIHLVNLMINDINDLALIHATEVMYTYTMISIIPNGIMLIGSLFLFIGGIMSTATRPEEYLENNKKGIKDCGNGRNINKADKK